MLSAEHVKEVDPKPGDRFLAFVTLVHYITLFILLVLLPTVFECAHLNQTVSFLAFLLHYYYVSQDVHCVSNKSM